MLRALSKTTGVTPYGYCYGDEGVVGATPELILAQKKSVFFTAAVAGTRHRDSPVSLLHSKKDLSEHQFVVDDLVSRLSTWGQVTVDCRQEVAAGDLVHLKTDIQLETQAEVSFFKVLEELHPTPALGAYPRESGLAWLKKQSGDRGGFGAPFGRMDEYGESTAWVGIRQLSWSKSGSRIGSGCGIVADSDFEKEWQELQFKRQSVKNLLGLCL
jgi:menaquinone-specific isochorismate synthase